MIANPALRTSSCGRLFDAIAAICGISQENSYEGESAMLLEAAAQTEGGEKYSLELDTATEPWTIDTRPMLREIAHQITHQHSPGRVARCFHHSIAHMIESVCSAIRERSGVDNVCLSGGTFQNFTLLSETVALLRRCGFRTFLHSQVPPNDGGISLGQAVIGAAYLDKAGANVSRNTRQN